MTSFKVTEIKLCFEVFFRYLFRKEARQFYWLIFEWRSPYPIFSEFLFKFFWNFFTRVAFGSPSTKKKKHLNMKMANSNVSSRSVIPQGQKKIQLILLTKISNRILKHQTQYYSIHQIHGNTKLLQFTKF